MDSVLALWPQECLFVWMNLKDVIDWLKLRCLEFFKLKLPCSDLKNAVNVFARQLSGPGLQRGTFDAKKGERKV